MTDPDEIKHAVKEALDDKRMTDLSMQLTNLATQMTEGFTRITTRQDSANGKLARHELDITQIKDKSSSSLLYTNILWLLITSLVSLLVFLITRK